MADYRCPFCGGPMWCEYVDIGVGMQQVTPLSCEDTDCHAVEMYGDRLFNPPTTGTTLGAFWRPPVPKWRRRERIREHLAAKAAREPRWWEMPGEVQP